MQQRQQAISRARPVFLSSADVPDCSWDDPSYPTCRKRADEHGALPGWMDPESGGLSWGPGQFGNFCPEALSGPCWAGWARRESPGKAFWVTAPQTQGCPRQRLDCARQHQTHATFRRCSGQSGRGSRPVRRPGAAGPRSVRSPARARRPSRSPPNRGRSPAAPASPGPPRSPAVTPHPYGALVPRALPFGAARRPVPVPDHGPASTARSRRPYNSARQPLPSARAVTRASLGQ